MSLTSQHHPLRCFCRARTLSQFPPGSLYPERAYCVERRKDSNVRHIVATP